MKRAIVAGFLAAALTGCASSAPVPGSLPLDSGGTPGAKSGKSRRVSKLEIQSTEDGKTPDDPGHTDPGNTIPVHPADPGHHEPGPGPNQVGQASASSGSGHLSRESIEQTIDDAGDSLGQCAEGYTTFAARVMVAANGSVIEARVTQSNPEDPRMQDCLTQALRRMKFQSSNGTVPLAFSLAIEPY